MRYSLLAAWAREADAAGMKVESVFSSQRGLRVRFKNKTDLCIICETKDSFAFFARPDPDAASNQKIWPQLANAELNSIQISPTDRIIRFGFSVTDIYQQSSRLAIIAELSPPHANVILARLNEEEIILDALHKYGYADNPQRQVLPNLPYQPPQTSFKPIAEELSLPAPLVSKKTGDTILCHSWNEYLATHYAEVHLAEQTLQARDSLRASWQKELRKAIAKLAKQTAELADAERVEYWQVCAETLKTNLQNIAPGQTTLKAINYFDPLMAEIEIPLQANLTPKQNLQAYLKKYLKAKRGKEIIKANLAASEQAISHLEGILARVESGDFTAAPGRQTLAGLGKKLELIDKLLRLRISDEFEIVIGRKARENDFVTTQLAQPHDWWFHTRIYHGAHVLLRCFRKTSPDERLIRLCCSLAAWYSKAKFSANVPVDYTQIRYVRKPRHAAPGYVTYTTHQTVFSAPLDLRAVRAELQL